MTESERLPRMLLLDDRTKRIEAARKKYTQQYDVTFVHNAKECLRYLCKQEWDIVSLDHDLDGNDFQSPEDTSSGMEVVRYMKVWMDQYPKPEVWVHSSNLFASRVMLSILKEYGFRAYYRKFEYDEQASFGDAKPSHKPVVVEDKWEKHDVLGLYLCLSCNEMKETNSEWQCHDCYKREMKQCA